MSTGGLHISLFTETVGRFGVKLILRANLISMLIS